MSKTAREWFNDKLSLSDCLKAKRNTISQHGVEKLDEQHATVMGALNGSFRWDKSKEGNSYWSKIYNKLENTE